MGWLGVLAAVPLAARLEGGGLAWLLIGGVLYTAGTVFYRNSRAAARARRVAPVRAGGDGEPLCGGGVVRAVAEEAAHRGATIRPAPAPLAVSR
jgi:hypothetical protein